MPQKLTESADHQYSRPKSIGKKVFLSLISSYFSQFFSKGCGLVTRIVLARLIVPAHWGIYAEALLVLTLFDTVRDLGISLHLVREKDPPYGNALIIEVLIALLFLIVIQGAAPYFSFLGIQVPQVLRVLFLAGVIQAFACIPETYIHKELLLQVKIKPLVLRNLVFSVASIILAWSGMGVWSLVFGHLIGNLVYTLFLWASVLKMITLEFTLSRTGELIMGSKYLLFMALLGVIGSQIDIGIVGTLLSAKKTGYYFMAFSLILYPSNIIESAVHNVIYPTFAHYQKDRVKLGEIYLLATSSVMALEVPIYTLLFFGAPILVEIFLGKIWLPIVPLVRILSFLSIIDPFSMFGQSLLKAVKQDRLLSGALIAGTLVLVLASVILTKTYGLYGTAIARYMIFGNILIILGVRQCIKKHFTALVRRLVVIYVGSFAIIGTLFLVSSGYFSPGAGLIISLFGVCLCWIVFYYIFPENANNVKQIIFSKA